MNMTKILPERFFKKYTVAAGVAAGATSDIGISDEEVARFAPFNVVNVINQSSQVCELIPDGITDHAMPFGNGTDKSFPDQNFSKLALKNLDGANATDADIFVLVQREVSTRDFLHYLGDILKGLVTGD